MNNCEFKVGDLVRYKKSIGKGFPGTAFLGIVTELRSTGCLVFNPEVQKNQFRWFHLLEPINEQE